MEEGIILLPKASAQAALSKQEKYQGMIGSIMFSIVETRLDIAFATSVVSRFAKNPGHQHKEAVNTILRYLKGSRDRSVTYGGEKELRIEDYSDSDWAGDKENRKSTSGYIFRLNRGPVSWCSKRQATVALSSTEAKYIALSLTAKEATWLRLLLIELRLLLPNQQHAEIRISNSNTSGKAIKADQNIALKGKEEEVDPCSDEGSIPLKGDNQGSIALAHNPVFHARTKHIDIQHHYIRDEVAEGRIELTYVPTDKTVADGLTKPLTHVKFHGF